MEKNFTRKFMNNRLYSFSLLFALFLMSGSTVLAQNFCANEAVFFIENFGTGTMPSSSPDVYGITYQQSGILNIDGTYRVVNNTQQNPGWHNSTDHTGNVDGKALVINSGGSATNNTFYQKVINRALGFPAGYYSSSLFFMNVIIPRAGIDLCGIPMISFKLEYQAQNNSWLPLIGSPVASPVVPLSLTPVWNQLGGVFTLPATGTFVVQNFRLSLFDFSKPGCGNDFAIDDIKLATCPSGGPLPVEFLDVSAKQRGAGVAINWSTASEIDNKYFDVEKSIDGGATWNIVTTVKSSGANSSSIKRYAALDARPVVGANFYRIKQVDLDGQYKYSITVNVKINLDKTVANVIANPFITNISIDFLSKSNQSVALNLYDVAGRKITSERFAIPKGNSRKVLDKVGILQRGMYILNIVDESGASIYNGKLLKQ